MLTVLLFLKITISVVKSHKQKNCELGQGKILVTGGRAKQDFSVMVLLL